MPAGNATISLGEVILAASQELRDEGFQRIGKPVYVSAAQRALQKLNDETSFYKKIFEAPIPEDLILDLPCDLTAKDSVYLFSGDDCDITTSTILFIKPNMYHKGGSGYLANNKGRNLDVLQWSLSPTQIQPQHLYFAGEYNGKLYLSTSCQRFDKVHIRYVGIGVNEMGDDFDIPMWAREAVTDFIILRCALRMELTDQRKYTPIINRKTIEMKSTDGSWAQAKWQYKKLDKKGRYDSHAYNFGFGHTP